MAPKYRLNLDDLLVESFQTESPGARKGTVYGHDSYLYSESTCHQIMCGCTYGGPNNGTCDLSCMGDPCEPTHINCQGCGSGGGCSGQESCGCPNTLDPGCCTGNQIICSNP